MEPGDLLHPKGKEIPCEPRPIMASGSLRIIGPSKLAFLEDPTPAIQVQTLPLEGPRSLGFQPFIFRGVSVDAAYDPLNSRDDEHDEHRITSQQDFTISCLVLGLGNSWCLLRKAHTRWTPTKYRLGYDFNYRGGYNRNPSYPFMNKALSPCPSNL